MNQVGWDVLAASIERLPAGEIIDSFDVAKAAAARGASAILVPHGFDGGRRRLPELALFDRELFDLGYIRLKPEFAEAAGAEAGQGTLYVRSDLLVRLDWLANPPEDAVVQISYFRNLGRFANRMFMYSNLILYRLRSCCRVEIPAWEEAELFPVALPAPSEVLPQQTFAPFHGSERHLLHLDDPMIGVDFFAYFQELTSQHTRHKAFIRRLLTPSGYYTGAINEWLAEEVPAGSTLVALHVRRGDYLNYGDSPWFRAIPVEWYLEWLPGVLSTIEKPVLYVATDDPENIPPRFAEYNPLIAPVTQLVEPAFSFLVDFHVMRRAKVLAMCNSSFSRMGALLGDDDKEVYIPNCPEKRFERYDPWADRAFWDRFGPGVA
ncbi:hypothetical protein ACFSM5_07385 [Lacibacterium aquatile]|uniref:Alpha-1,2-fucosyltransferase n=1 Tax=Lacibacterium aquatile TaxID=1168082 RepID=A0ABW5DQC7_9PROT